MWWQCLVLHWLGGRGESGTRVARLTGRVGHLGVLGQLERHHRIPSRLERDRLAPTPARISGNRVGAKVALARDEGHEAASERIVAAAGAEEARGVVGGALRDEVLVLCEGTQAGGRSAGVAKA